MAFVTQHDGHARVQERQLAQPPLQQRKLKLRPGERPRTGLERDLGAVDVIRIGAHDSQRFFGIAMAEADAVLNTVPPDPHLHPFRQSVDHRGADAMQPTGDFV